MENEELTMPFWCEKCGAKLLYIDDLRIIEIRGTKYRLCEDCALKVEKTVFKEVYGGK